MSRIKKSKDEDSAIILDEAAVRKDALTRLRKRFRLPKYADRLENGCYNFAIDYCDANNLGAEMVISIYMDRTTDFENCCKDLAFAERIMANDFKVTEESTENIAAEDEDATKSTKPPANFRYVTISEVPYLQLQQLDSKNWIDLISRKRLREDKMKNASTTDLFTCSKCGHKKSYIWRMQTRSADEPMTTFIRCLICSHTFKQ
jgi:DNA-directed RNA polymerase subunit M/transcription elongation factor TFIIS